MSASNNNHKLNFQFTEDGGRPWVRPYVQLNKFRVGDRVYLIDQSNRSRQGPFLIASVPSSRRYTLSLANGQAANNGNEVEEQRLEKVSATSTP